MFAAIWRWWTETWHAPRRARLLYLAMGTGFAALGAVAAASGEAAVAAIGFVAGAVTATLAVVVPRLSRWSGPPEDVR